MPSASHDVVLEQGATFLLNLTYNISGIPVNLTGYTARMQVRETIESDTALVTMYTGSGITLGGSAGTVDIEIDATTTANFDFETAYYDLELVGPAPNYRVTRLIQGVMTLNKEVTRV